jgi:hypothetical protein
LWPSWVIGGTPVQRRAQAIQKCRSQQLAQGDGNRTSPSSVSSSKSRVHQNEQRSDSTQDQRFFCKRTNAPIRPPADPAPSVDRATAQLAAPSALSPIFTSLTARSPRSVRQQAAEALARARHAASLPGGSASRPDLDSHAVQEALPIQPSPARPLRPGNSGHTVIAVGVFSAPERA